MSQQTNTSEPQYRLTPIGNVEKNINGELCLKTIYEVTLLVPLDPYSVDSYKRLHNLLDDIKNDQDRLIIET